ncbi:hypothetical protein RE428_33170 [Marinobacter nanhaiticus D15-8W]|nr:hypothetical protein RE428_33170 [Marinobacter nanhaiticus D15-8W]
MGVYFPDAVPELIQFFSEGPMRRSSAQGKMITQSEAAKMRPEKGASYFSGNMPNGKHSGNRQPAGTP